MGQGPVEHVHGHLNALVSGLTNNYIFMASLHAYKYVGADNRSVHHSTYFINGVL